MMLVPQRRPVRGTSPVACARGRRVTFPNTLGSVLDYLAVNKYAALLYGIKKLYGANAVAGSGGDDFALKVIKQASAHYRAGYPRTASARPKLKTRIMSDLGLTGTTSAIHVATILAYLESFTAQNDATANAFLSPSGITASAIVSDAKKSVKSATEELTNRASDTKAALLDAFDWKKAVTFAAAAAIAVAVGNQLIKASIPISYKANPVGDNSRKKYKEFHARNPKRMTSIDMPDCSELVLLGNGLEIGYSSSKWTGKKENYLHKFGKGVKLYCTPDGKTLVIQGGRLDVKNVGIVN